MRDPTAEDVDATQPPCGLLTPEASVASLALPLPGTGTTRRSPGEPSRGVRAMSSRRFNRKQTGLHFLVRHAVSASLAIILGLLSRTVVESPQTDSQ
jgi:hypothetical protein